MSSGEQYPLTRALAHAVPGGSRTKGRLYHLDGAVTRLEGTPWSASATVRGSREYRLRIGRSGDVFRVSCECPYFFDRLTTCKHIWAAMLEAERRGALLGDGSIGPDARIETDDPDEESDVEFRSPPAARAPALRSTAQAPWEQFLNEFSRHLSTDARATRAPRFAGAQLVYVIDRTATLATGVVALDVMARQGGKTGDGAKPKAVQMSLRDLEEVHEPADREILPLLFGAVDTYSAYAD